MGRIPESNPRFRTKGQICQDVCYVLNAPIPWGTQFAVVAEALWVWSEFEGKYRGCRQWSKSAQGKFTDERELRHDHAVPKKYLIGRLAERRGSATVERVRLLLDAHCIGVVITRDQDNLLTKKGLRASMPPGWDGTDPLARYRAAGIALKTNIDQS